jgi:hypothetical protein
MNKEQIKDLANFIWEGGLHLADIKDSIDEWFEQNPVEPIVVGLTNEQIEAISIIVRPYDDSNRIRNIISGYLMGEKFARQEIPVGLSDEQVQS